jgi:hypothetical protein
VRARRRLTQHLAFYCTHTPWGPPCSSTAFCVAIGMIAGVLRCADSCGEGAAITACISGICLSLSYHATVLMHQNLCRNQDGCLSASAAKMSLLACRASYLPETLPCKLCQARPPSDGARKKSNLGYSSEMKIYKNVLA